MMESNTKRVASCVDEDRISNLPELLIDSILERLPIEDAVRTSILSKTWSYKWTTMRLLVFDERFFKKFTKNGAFGRNGFIRIINRVLILHKGSILKFHLHLPNMFLDSFQEVDQFILLLSRNNVRELILINSNQHYAPLVFSCLELTKLKLENCFFKRPLEFEGFPNLEELFFKNIDFGANVSGTEICMPQLKTLSLRNCTNVHNFNIKATKLLKLTVVACPDDLLLRLLNSPCLTSACIYFLKPVEEFVLVEKLNLIRVLSNLPRVKHFYIDRHFLKFLIAENVQKWLPHAINSLKSLLLLNFQLADLDQLHGALYLLRNSPNLKRLYLQMEHVQMEPLVDVGPASNHLESPNCLDCTLNRLQTVEINHLDGSRPELFFIKLLLAHSPSLEKFTIRPSRPCDVQKGLDILTDVTQFPRVSPKAKMFYLKP